jgi:hypothetical protein
MIIYEKITVGDTETIKGTLQDGSVIFIPTDPANSDYQAYLAWLEDPNAEITPPVL